MKRPAKTLTAFYVIMDPKGTVLPETVLMLERAGYEIRVFNAEKRETSREAAKALAKTIEVDTR